MRLAVGLVVMATAASSSSQLTISHRTIRLQPGAEFSLAANGGTSDPCAIEWASERPDITEVLSTSCDGGSSFATVRTHELPPASEGRVITFVTARARDDKGDDTVYCEVNVAPIARLHIQTTVRDMLAHELQWLELAAEDGAGNAFSPAGLEALDVEWRFDPPGLVELLPPSETRQQLDAPLQHAEESKVWQRFYRVAIRAGGQPAEAFAAMARTATATAKPEALSIELPIVTLTPPGRAVLAPSFELQYALRSCASRGGRCSAPPASELRTWSVAPDAVATVTSDGLLTAIKPGEATVGVTQPLLNVVQPLLVSPPARLQIDIIDTRSLAPADPAWSGQPEQPITLRYQEGKRLLKLRMLSRDGGGLAHLLPSPPINTSYLLPALTVAAATTGGDVAKVLTLKSVPASQCGEDCTLGRTAHALCRCEQIMEHSPGSAVFTATLDGSPPSFGEEPWPSDGAWSALSNAVTVHLVAPLALAPPSERVLAWACAKGVTVPVLPLPSLTGGSGSAEWTLNPAEAADPSSGTPLKALRALQPASFYLTVRDTLAHIPPAVASLRVERIASLSIDAPSTALAVGSSATVTLYFLGTDGQPLHLNSCDDVQFSWQLSKPSKAFKVDGGETTSGIAKCKTGCTKDGAACATVELMATGVGSATLGFSFASGCEQFGEEVTTSLELITFKPPPKQEVRLCAPAVEGEPPSAGAIPLKGLAPTARNAALTGGLTVSKLSGDGLLVIELSAEVGPAIESIAGEAEDEIAVQMHCLRAHEQSVTLDLVYAAAMPPLTLRLHVVCGTPPAAASKGAAAVKVDVGERRAVPLTLPWKGARLLGSLRASESTYAALEGVSYMGALEAGADGGSWTAIVTGVAPGSSVLTLEAEGAHTGSVAPGCQRSVPVHIGIGGFTIACPSTSLLMHASMVCYALASTADGAPLAPSPELLAGMAYRWSVGGGGDGGAVHVAPFAMEGAFAATITATAVGVAEVGLVATALDGTFRFTSSTTITSQLPLASRIHSQLTSASPLGAGEPQST